MKRLKISIVFILLLTTKVFSQADKVVGFWLTAEGDSQIEISKMSNGCYSGKVAWMKNDQNAKDDKNPELKLKNRKIMGLQILSNFRFNEKDNEWVEGTIYDPKNGKSYDCYMWFEKDKNELMIKGFVLGVRFLGRETSWKRENKLRLQISNK